MSTQPRADQPSKQPSRRATHKDEKEAEETLHDQAKTETEERPYLDTQGGE